MEVHHGLKILRPLAKDLLNVRKGSCSWPKFHKVPKDPSREHSSVLIQLAKTISFDIVPLRGSNRRPELKVVDKGIGRKLSFCTTTILTARFIQSGKLTTLMGSTNLMEILRNALADFFAQLKKIYT